MIARHLEAVLHEIANTGESAERHVSRSNKEQVADLTFDCHDKRLDLVTTHAKVISFQQVIKRLVNGGIRFSCNEQSDAVILPPIYIGALILAIHALVPAIIFSSSHMLRTLGCLTTSLAHLSKLGAFVARSSSTVADTMPCLGSEYTLRTQDPAKTWFEILVTRL